MSDVTFNSEEERLEAINAIDDSKPDSLDELQKIQDAEIVEKAPEADSETPEETPAKEPVSEPEPQETETVDKEPEPQPEDGKTWTLKPEDLPENFDTPGKAFKTLQHQAEYIKKQTEENEALRQQIGSQTPTPEPVKTPVEEPVQSVNDYDAQIKSIEEKIYKQYDEDPLDPSIPKMQLQLVDLKSEQQKAYFDERAKEIEQKATGQFEEYRKSEEQKRIDKLNEETLSRDYNELDELGKEKDYEEYKMSKPAKDVEKDFLLLRDAIVTAYYDGKKTQNWNEVNNALYQFNNRAPSLINKLQAMNIPTEYPQDVKTYLELSKLLNERDGVSYNANGEQIVYRKRWDPVRGEEVPDRFPDLKATVEYQRVNSGFYKQKELSAYDKGSKDTLRARSKRDNDELQANDGNLDVGKLTLEQLVAEQKKLPETAENLEKLLDLNKRIEQIAKQPTG